MKMLLAALSFGLLSANLCAEEKPVTRVSSEQISADNSPEAIARAVENGVRSAKRDIMAGDPVILYFGKPWSAGKALIDDSTKLPVEIVGGSAVSSCFVQEVTAYNKTVRAWHAEKVAADAGR